MMSKRTIIAANYEKAVLLLIGSFGVAVVGRSEIVASRVCALTQ
jgi:hypothetical protein